MKAIITLFALALGFSTMAQQEEVKIATIDDSPEIGCIIPLKTIEPIVYAWDADGYYRTQVVQPAIAWNIHRLHCGNSNFDYDAYYQSLGPQPLNEDLPFVHTLTGAAFTFDYIRNTARP